MTDLTESPLLPACQTRPSTGDQRQNLIGMNRQDLVQEMAHIGESKFRAQQIFQWIYNRGMADFAGMTNISKPLRHKLKDLYKIDRLAVTDHQKSVDKTQKWLVQFADQSEAETVFIPEDERGTLCVSSQVGCSLTCRFCHTGTQRLVRNLTAGDIINQVMLARDILDDWPSSGQNRQLSNVVMMGMGEPLYNTDNVIKAMQIMMDGDGLAISKRRITLSTSGVLPPLQRVGQETGVQLAISLHAVHDDLRNVLVPINRKYPIRELLNEVRHYPGLSNSNRVTWEYVMLKGVNDSPSDAKALVRLIQGIPSKVNLIPFNPWPGSDYVCSDEKAMRAFAEIIWDAGYSSPIRTPRGRDILAACGQLKSESQRAKPIKALIN